MARLGSPLNMARTVHHWVILLLPSLVGSVSVWADDISDRSDPFGFDPDLLDPIQFTRADADDDGKTSSRSISGVIIDPSDDYATGQKTEFSFKLRQKLPDFSSEGAYGFDLFAAPRLNINSRSATSEAVSPSLSQLHDGLEYSAGLKIEHEDLQFDNEAFVSSSLLGLSYGRLGRLWYGAIDVNLEQFSTNDAGHEPSDILSFDVTTGRRLGFTGLDTNSPLWLLSFHGNVDMQQWEENDDLEASGDWYLNPSLFWQQPGFVFSAQMQLPIEFENLDDEGEPDYRLRAVFEKQFK